MNMNQEMINQEELNYLPRRRAYNPDKIEKMVARFRTKKMSKMEKLKKILKII